MFPQNCLSKGHSLLPLGLVALTSCIIIEPCQAQAIQDMSSARKSGVGVAWEDSELSPFLRNGDTRLGINSTNHSSSTILNRAVETAATQTKPAYAGFKTLDFPPVRAGGLRFYSREFHSPGLVASGARSQLNKNLSGKVIIEPM